MSDLSDVRAGAGWRTHGRLAAGLGALVLLAGAALGCGDGGNEAPAATTGPGTVTKPATLEGFSTPESVLFAGDRWFVSNIGPESAPVTKDGDGFLTELNSVGTVTARRAMPRPGDPPLHAPKGMAYTDNRVFVADIDRVVGYDMDTHGQVFEAVLDGGEPSLLNDLALLDPGTLLASDSLRGIVYRLDLETKKFEPLATGIPGANGIAVATATVHVAGTGADFTGGDLWRLDLAQQPAVPQRIGTVHGVLDGIAVLPNGNLIVSDWASGGETPGTVTVYGPDGARVALVQLPENTHGPADFTLDATAATAWIPAMPDNRVVIVPLP
ncbi:SMP-30/gluconolactonase/LRE family protein [Nocardia crassostreae]|uniref:SMP-30/gluconolactonase/LRE family protein n=1 Tax=Nocardia crassostreae TaxID=53428 RepID=UPI000831575F|nr:SMP-30/gluconolactonase/LRE family protein [Nocardia crassostreae]